METKKVWESKTFWVNLVAGAVAAIQIFNPEFQLSTATTETLVLIGGSVLVPVINIGLRFITNKKVTM